MGKVSMLLLEVHNLLSHIYSHRRASINMKLNATKCYVYDPLMMMLMIDIHCFMLPREREG